jgi:hypothetical protein
MSNVTRTINCDVSHSNGTPPAKSTLSDVQTSTTIERVPIEIMDQIFEEYIEMDQSACNLTFVSRTWRSLALANPWLWRYILISYESASPFKKWHPVGLSAGILTQGKAQVCQGNDDFMAATKRSSSIPLHIIYRREREQNGESILKQVLTLPISSRVIVLEINNWWLDTRPIMAQITLGPFTQLSRLRVTALEHIQNEEFIRTIHHSAPLLTALEFIALTDSYLTLPILTSLRALEFYELRVEPQAFHSLLSRCHQLVKLSTRQCVWFDSNTRLGPGVLANLEIANFECDLRALSALELVNLRSLDVKHCIGCRKGSSWQRIHLPKLVTLRIRFTHSIEAFKHLEMPLLQDLHITLYAQYVAPNTGLIEIPSSLWFPTLTRLYIKTCWDENTFSTFMNAAPRVREINFVYEGPRDPFFWDSVFHILAYQPVCPKLKSCMIADKDHPVTQARPLLASLIHQIQAYRKEYAMPEPCFEVYHSSSSGVERIEYN